MTHLVLLTGITGFVGGATAVELLTQHADGRILALVRADSIAKARERVRRSLVRFLNQKTFIEIEQRVEIILGDIIDPNTLESPLVDKVTEVLHLAANTSLRSIRGVRRTNVIGTQALFNRLYHAPQLRRILYVGTAHICGIGPGELVFEDDFPRANVNHAVEYTRSKAECELWMRRKASRLPIVVARPSTVVGHTQLGCVPSASIYWYYRLVDRLGLISSSTQSLKDIVPVDYVAQALAALLFKPNLAHAIYHVSAGQHAAVRWRDMQAAFAQCDGRELGPPYRTATVEEILTCRESIAAIVGEENLDFAIRALEPFLRLSASGVQVFDNARLLAEGVKSPPRFTDYLHACISQQDRRSLFAQLCDDG
jgi:thioester reductase-like protein